MTTARKLRIRAVENASGAKGRGVGNIVYKVGEWYESLVALDTGNSTRDKGVFVLFNLVYAL